MEEMNIKEAFPATEEKLEMGIKKAEDLLLLVEKNSTDYTDLSRIIENLQNRIKEIKN